MLGINYFKWNKTAKSPKTKVTTDLDKYIYKKLNGPIQFHINK